MAEIILCCFGDSHAGVLFSLCARCGTVVVCEWSSFGWFVRSLDVWVRGGEAQIQMAERKKRGVRDIPQTFGKPPFLTMVWHRGDSELPPPPAEEKRRRGEIKI